MGEGQFQRPLVTRRWFVGFGKTVASPHNLKRQQPTKWTVNAWEIEATPVTQVIGAWARWQLPGSQAAKVREAKHAYKTPYGVERILEGAAEGQIIWRATCDGVRYRVSIHVETTNDCLINPAAQWQSNL